MSPNATAPMRGNFVLLRADTLRLLLPQADVGAAEYLDARPQPAAQPGILQLDQNGSARRFAALSGEMTLLPQCPAARFVAATLEHGDHDEADADKLAWCWDDLQVLIDVWLEPQPLAAVLLTPDTPVAEFVEHEGHIAYLCTARRLAEFALASRS